MTKPLQCVALIKQKKYIPNLSHYTGSIEQCTTEFARHCKSHNAQWGQLIQDGDGKVLAFFDSQRGLTRVAQFTEEPTTWMARYRASIALYCRGIEPPLSLCEDWFNPAMDSFDLQDWCACNAGLPWAQGIAILDAAEAMADNPEEGVGHLPREKSELDNLPSRN